MRYLLFVCALLAGCATAPQPAAERNNELARELASDILSEKVAKNGEKLLCSQSGYNACFGISEAQCIKETVPLKQQCIDTATSKVGELKVGETEKKFGQIFAACMAMRHLMLHADKAKEISACMRTMQYDKDAAVRSLLR